MKLQGRNLGIDMQGDDVGLLHRELRQLGFVIPDPELQQAVFGTGTREAVAKFQVANGLAPSGEVDENTAQAINAQVGALQQKPYVVRGRVRQADDSPTAGILVRAYDKDSSGETLLGETHSDAEGRYEIRYTEVQFRRSDRANGGANLVVRTYDTSGALVAASLQLNNAPPEASVDLVIGDISSAQQDFVVRGKVLQADGTPLARARVRATDKDLRKEDLLGQVLTGPDGRYEIHYPAARFGRAEQGTADLRVAVLNEKGDERVSSEVLFNVPAEVEINLTAPAVPDLRSEFERLIETIAVLLEGQAENGSNLPLVALTDDDVAFLSSDTGIDRQRIAWLIQAARLAAEPGAGMALRALRSSLAVHAPDRSLSLPAQLFYGLFRQGQPTSLEELVQRPDTELAIAVKRSIEANLIPGSMMSEIGAMAEFFSRVRAALALQPSTEGATSVGDVLATLPAGEQLTQSEALEFARLHSEHGLSNRLWEAVDAGDLASKRLILQRAYALQSFTQAHAPMMAALQARLSGTDTASLDDLASVSSREWLDLAFERGVPQGSRLSPAEYAAQLERSVERQYPTAVLRERFRSGTPGLGNFPSEQVGDFLATHRDFDLLQHDVPTYLQEAAIDSPELRDGLLQLKRLWPLTGRLDATLALLASGTTSQYRIAQSGYGRLREQLGNRLDENTMRDIYRSAATTADTALALSTTIIPLFFNVASSVLPGAKQDTEGSRGATLRTLFGDQGFCECQHCQSVLGPAAYLADLLHFLETSRAHPGSSVLDALLTRRPDLGDLELSCENTNTEIPYIDLVLEILENAVALDPPLAIGLAAVNGLDIENELGAGRVPAPIRTALRETAITIGDVLTVQRAPGPMLPVSPRRSEWIVSDGSRRWRVAYQTRQLAAWRDVPTETKPPLALPAFSALSAIETGLRAGSLHIDLVRHFAPDPIPPVKGVPQVVPVATTPAGVPGWKVSIRQEVQVEIVPGVSMGAVRLYFDGQAPTTLPLPTGQWQLIAAWLVGSATGVNAEAALRLLELPQTLEYKRSRDTATGRYAVQVDTDIVLAIVPEALTINALTYQNSSIRTHLAALPENRNPKAYEKLRQAVFPWTLPLDLWTEEIRAFLAALGVPRRRLIEIARPARLSSALYTGELLGLSPAELGIITQPAGTELWIAWGLQELNNNISDTLGGERWTGSWLDVLKHVSMVMQQARLSYRELLEVLQSSLGGRAKPAIEPLEECRPNKQVFSAIAPEQLDWIHRFTRLQRRLGWPARELDRALRVFDNIIDPGSVRGLSLMLRLNERLHTMPVALCAMLGHLENRPWTRYTEEGSPTESSLYERLFQPPALRKSDSFPFFTLNAAGELAYLDQTPPPAAKRLSDHVEYAASCLGIKPAELGLLLNAAGEIGLTDEIQIANLATLHGLVQFARGLGLSTDELLRWQKVLQREPFKRLEPDDTLPVSARAQARLQRAEALLDFADDLDFAKQSGQSLDGLEYLLRHTAPREAANMANTRLVAGLATIWSAVRSGEVLGNATYENLLHQLERAGVPPPVVAGLRSDEDLAKVLQAEINLSPIQQPVPGIPEKLRGRFYLITAPDGQSARFGCRGAVSDTDFEDLRNVGPGEAAVTDSQRAALQARYNLVREVWLTQMQYHPLPLLKAGVLAAPSPAIPADLAGCLRYDQAAGQIQLTGVITAVQRDALKAAMPHLSAPLDTLFGQSEAFLKQSRPLLAADLARDLVLTARTDELIVRALRSLVPLLEPDLLAAQVATFTGLEQGLCAALLKEVKVTVAGTARPAKEILFDQTLLASDAALPIDAQQFSAQLAALARLDKAALLLAKSGLTSERLDWLLDGVFEILDINRLPAEAGEPAANFTDWRAFQELWLFVRSVPGGQATVEALADALTARAAAPASAVVPDAVLGTAYDLPVAPVSEAYRALLEMAWPADFRKPGRLLQLATLLNLLRRLGTTPAVLEQLVAEQAAERDAIAARALFVGQFDADAVSQRLEPVSNRLRPRQRDALVDYLRAAQDLADADALLDYFLIDVQMEACMRTSRIKQAISSVQLYVQRCLLNLERKWVAPSDLDARRWEWMKNYRVWEANRKVFLYPENWIEPELRDDKTEIFRQLESDLLQTDLTYEASLEAFIKYLESASDLARPVIVALWDEDVDSHERVLHIVARDRTTPHKHFYRTVKIKARDSQAKPTLEWRPWETVEGDFASGHVLVFTLDSRVYIVCPSIRTGDDGSWKIYLQALKRGADGWKTKKQSVESISHSLVPGKDIGQSFIFKLRSATTPTGDTMRVDCLGAIVSPDEQIPESDVKVTLDRGDFIGFQPIPNFPMDGTTYDPQINYYSQHASTIRFRVLERYIDTVNANTAVYRRRGQPLYVSAVIECDWYITDEPRSDVDVLQPEKIMQDPAHDSRLINRFGVPIGHELGGLRTFADGQCEVANTDLKDFFDVRTSVANLQLGPRLKCVPKRVTEITLYTLGTSRHTKLAYRVTLDLVTDDFGEGTLRCDLVVELRKGEVPTEADITRSVSFEYLGSFAFEESSSLAISVTADDLDGGLTVPSPLRGCEHYCSGFRSLSAPAPLEYYGQRTILMGGQAPAGTAANDRFFVAPRYRRASVEEPLGAYSDTRFVLYFLPDGSRFRVLPEGQAWLSAGIRRLLRQVRQATNLETLPAGTTGTDAPKIPFDTGSDLVNFAASPATVDLAFKGDLPSSPYDWEVFFHVPLLIATQLSQGQRFTEARRWFHTIFDPTSNAPGDDATRYWRFKPFQDAARGESIEEVLAALAAGERDLSDEIDAWKDNPFNPHLVARFRIRAYQWAVVIKYIQNLIAWGDQLFRRDTIEAINEATQLYMLAARILGARPASKPRLKSPTLSYRDMAGRLDDFSNKWVEFENTLVPLMARPASATTSLDEAFGDTSKLSRVAHADASPNGYTAEITTEALRSIGTLYFCIPQNESILTLWDTVDDRLFNIRNCMNFDGVERRLPLFEPPIDPALLVRAVAAGLDLAAVLSDLAAPLPLYRFPMMLQKSLELASDVRAFGAAVLAALEKKDAEELALLRASFETTLLGLTEQVRQQQIQEAKAALEGLQESRKTVEERYRYHQHRLGFSEVNIPKPDEGFNLASIPVMLAKSGLDSKEQGLGMSQTEQDQLRRLIETQGLTLTSGILATSAGVAFGVGAYPPAALVAQSIGHSLNATSSALRAAAEYMTSYASHDAIIGGYERRRDEWIFLGNMALRELAQIDKQIAAAQIREAMAKQELANTRRQISNAQEVEAFLGSKYSNRELYRFMSNQLLSIYFRTYQLAFDLAKRVERCYRFELGLPDASFVKFGYWDSARKGVLAGEQLHLDLRRMEAAYFEQNKREYEITKHVSILQLDPVALISLRQTGSCEVSIPEALFDLDFPGHYLRRIKMVNLTIPCVTGPYSGVPCTLTLLKSEIRNSTAISGGYKRSESNAARFTDLFGPIQSIVTSSGQNDSGLFEPNLRDERYLPFEGAGVISTWRLHLPDEFRQFDYNTISDVVLHVRYTAREGGARLRQQAAQELQAALKSLIVRDGQPAGLGRVFSLRHEFPTAFNQLLHAAGEAQGTKIELGKQHFPFFATGAQKRLTLSSVTVFLSPKQSAPIDSEGLKLKLTHVPNPQDADWVVFDKWMDFGGNMKANAKSLPGDPLGNWTINAGPNGLDREALGDILILMQYSVSTT